MEWLRIFAARLRGLFRKRQLDGELYAELRAHLEMLTEENIRRGMSPEEARHAARREFGGVEQAKVSHRELRGLPFLETLFQDIRYALRMLRKNPGFTAVVVLTLALGIGANTAIFSLMNAVLLQSLPVGNPQELVVVKYLSAQSERANEDFSYPMYQALHDKSSVFDGVIARSGVSFNATYSGQSEHVSGEIVSGNYYAVLGVRPWLGRLFFPEDDRTPGAHPVAVLSYAYWQVRFAGDPSIVGKQILLDAQPMTVVGVSAPGFFGTDLARDPAIRVPMAMTLVFKPVPANRMQSARHRWLTIMARRKPEVSIAMAQAATEVLHHQVLEEQLNRLGSSVKAHDRERILATHIQLDDGSQGFAHLREEMKQPLVLMFSVTAIVLLVACANLANLLLARSAKRRREVAVRLAIGAEPGRLIRQWLTESILLGVLGGATGIVFAHWLKTGLIHFLPAEFSNTLRAPLDARVLGFLAIASVFTGILFGLAPALQISRSSVTAAMHGEASLTASGERVFSLRNALVFLQVALSLPLLIGAGLFLHSLSNLRGVDTGFVKENVFLANLNPSLNGYPTERIRGLYHDLLARLRAVPQVRAASLTSSSAISGGWDQLSVRVEGYQPKQDENMSPNAALISPGYFASLGIPIIQGRDFSDEDTATRPKVAIINQTFARYFFGDANPIGRRVSTNDDPKAPLEMEIIGVVKDSKYVSLREKPRRHLYTAMAQEPHLFDMTLQVRTTDDPRSIGGLVRAQVHDIDPNLPLYATTTLEIQIDDSLTSERLVTWLSSLFGIVATLLASIGLSGVIAFSVARRTREIGIRVALGAQRGDVLRMVVSQTALSVSAGMVVGLAVAYALGRLMTGMLYEVGSTDPRSYAAASVSLAVVASLAAYLPARRATQVDPVTALRYE
ncbi:MAG TPA: ABC transporter permease [Candidatus Acidoferrum sp.]|nr:ABC transporter permease [Candidatus Acidoferrum sp.]